jgi:hypothetical protein
MKEILGPCNMQGRDEKNTFKILIGRLSPRWEVIFELILRKQGEMLWIGFIWLRIGTSSLFL